MRISTFQINKYIYMMVCIIAFLVQASLVNGAQYQVKKGDTLWQIAQNHNIPLNALMNANPGLNANTIYPGMVLHIPDSSNISYSSSGIAPIKGQPSRSFGLINKIYYPDIQYKVTGKQQVKSMNSGIILEITYLPGYGTCVFVKHDDGYISLYGGHHLSVSVKENQRVSQGASIASINTSSPSIINVALFYNQKPVNPLNYFSVE